MFIEPKPGECYHVRSIRATIVSTDPDGQHVWVKVGSGTIVKVPITTLVAIKNPPPTKPANRRKW